MCIGTPIAFYAAEELDMNAKITSFITIIAAAGILTLASCANPAAPRLGDPDEPDTGISADPESGLVAGLDLEGDAILSNPDVIVSEGVEWTAGLSGNAMRGDEDGDYIRIADEALPELTSSGTVEAWVNPETNTAWAGILHKGQEIDFSDESWSLQYDGGKKPRFYLYGESKSTYVTANLVLTTGEWHHLAAAWTVDESDALTVTLYVNGVAEATKTVADFGPVKDSAGDLIIGSQLPEPLTGGLASYGHVTFRGLIDVVRLYDVERSAAEIQADYDALAPAP